MTQVPVNNWQAQMTRELQANLAALSQTTFGLSFVDSVASVPVIGDLRTILTDDDNRDDTDLLLEIIIDIANAFFVQLLAFGRVREGEQRAGFGDMVYRLDSGTVHILLLVRRMSDENEALRYSIQALILQQTTHTSVPTRLTVAFRNESYGAFTQVKSDTGYLRSVLRYRPAELLCETLVRFKESILFEEPYGALRDVEQFLNFNRTLFPMYGLVDEREARIAPLFAAVLAGSERARSFIQELSGTANNVAAQLASQQLGATQANIDASIRELVNLLGQDPVSGLPSRLPVGMTRGQVHKLIALMAIELYNAEPRDLLLASRFGNDNVDYAMVPYTDNQFDTDSDDADSAALLIINMNQPFGPMAATTAARAEHGSRVQHV